MIPLGDDLRQLLGLTEGEPTPKKKIAKVRLNRTKPKAQERVETEEATLGKSYEEANWARLSPQFREAHNRLRQMRGMTPLPPPKVDLYVKPRGIVKAVDMNAPEAKAAAAQFLSTPMMGKGDEGFSINGEPTEFDPRPRRKRSRENFGEGFTINGQRMR